ncbi:monothiol glutaredoxin-S5-like [Salvia miltiorrhiza]|uniref:monothiol glutaredoxin-S5-like n=1 Tax=Salvia miltiorrhiza TaxID=226208 RepID=UPI0025AC1922|nr:monothiol glutaredoxin-S5-like [Salvia miltiorrhiza]
MQKALHYRNLLPPAASAGGSAIPPPGDNESGGESVAGAVNLRKLVAENAVVVFARKGCCMCHVVKLLLNGHGVNPTILDVDEQNEGDVTNQLSRIAGGVGSAPPFPAVFVGGKLFGGLEQVMGAHISGELVPRLREARALWL